VRERIINPFDAVVKQRRHNLLERAAKRSPDFGGKTLPRLLQPLQKDRCTATQALRAFQHKTTALYSDRFGRFDSEPHRGVLKADDYTHTSFNPVYPDGMTDAEYASYLRALL
jgi:hypothetical protein